MPQRAIVLTTGDAGVLFFFLLLLPEELNIAPVKCFCWGTSVPASVHPDVCLAPGNRTALYLKEKTQHRASRGIGETERQALKGFKAQLDYSGGQKGR